MNERIEADLELTRMLHEAMPFTRTLGMEAIAASTDQVVVRGGWSAERCTSGGILHGGYLMALADAAGATLASFNLPPGAVTSTIESKTNFIRPSAPGRSPSRRRSCTAVVPRSCCRSTRCETTPSWPSGPRRPRR